MQGAKHLRHGFLSHAMHSIDIYNQARGIEYTTVQSTCAPRISPGENSFQVSLPRPKRFKGAGSSRELALSRVIALPTHTLLFLTPAH